MKNEKKEVLVTDEFVEWYQNLGEKDAEAVYHYVGLLEARGTTLGHPYSSAIRGCRHPIRELRVQSGGRPLRVFYAFDPRRNAVLLMGGDKTGRNRFYDEFVPLAENIWEEYLASAAKELDPGEPS